MSPRILWLGLGLLPTLLSCGGGGAAVSSAPATTGQLGIRIVWPTEKRLIPDASNSVQVTVYRTDITNPNGTPVLILEHQQVVNRPQYGNLSVISVSLPANNVKTYEVQATAFPQANAGGIAQASGTSGNILLVPGVNGSLQGATQNTFSLTMATTVDHIAVSLGAAEVKDLPFPQAVTLAGSPGTYNFPDPLYITKFVATPRDVAGNQVLVTTAANELVATGSAGLAVTDQATSNGNLVGYLAAASQSGPYSLTVTYTDNDQIPHVYSCFFNVPSISGFQASSANLTNALSSAGSLANVLTNVEDISTDRTVNNLPSFLSSSASQVDVTSNGQNRSLLGYGTESCRLSGNVVLDQTRKTWTAATSFGILSSSLPISDASVLDLYATPWQSWYFLGSEGTLYMGDYFTPQASAFTYTATATGIAGSDVSVGASPYLAKAFPGVDLLDQSPAVYTTSNGGINRYAAHGSASLALDASYATGLAGVKDIAMLGDDVVSLSNDQVVLSSESGQTIVVASLSGLMPSDATPLRISAYYAETTFGAFTPGTGSAYVLFDSPSKGYGVVELDLE